MMNYHEIIKHDLSPYGSKDDSLVEIAINIIDFFKSHNPKHHNRLSMRSFMEIVPCAKNQPEHLAKVLIYFSNERIHLFKMIFMLLNPDNGDLLKINYDDLNDAYQAGYLIHPETGKK